MPDAEVIPLGTRGEPGRGSGRRTTPSAASRSLAPSTPRPRRKVAKKAAPAGPTGRLPTPPLETPPIEAPPAEAPGARPKPRPARNRAAQPAPERTAKARPPSPTRRVATAGKSAVPKAVPDAPTPPPAPPERVAASPTGAFGAGALVDFARFVGQVAEEALSEEQQRAIADGLALVRRRLTGDYSVDDLGFDPELTSRVLVPLLRPLYQQWFRVEVRGIDNVPREGGALVVANHSGTIALDSLMTQVAIHDEHPANRHLRMLGADFVFRYPVLGELARKSGSTLACTEDAERLLSSGELVGVWPEGFKGIGKPFRERYKLQRFGRGGFVSAALRTGTPIIPCSIVGAEEIYPVIGELPMVARLLGAPYFPVTPTFPWFGPLGLVPLPSKWIIEFGEPIRTDDQPRGAAEDPMLTFSITDQVRETIQQTLYALLVSRRRTFF